MKKKREGKDIFDIPPEEKEDPKKPKRPRRNELTQYIVFWCVVGVIAILVGLVIDNWGSISEWLGMIKTGFSMWAAERRAGL